MADPAGIVAPPPATGVDGDGTAVTVFARSPSEACPSWVWELRCADTGVLRMWGPGDPGTSFGTRAAAVRAARARASASGWPVRG